MTADLSPEALAAIDRVTKLLALARDKRGNENEAQNALDMAHQILEKHNLDMALVERRAGEGTHAHQKREDKTTGGGLYKWQREVWEGTAELNFCRYFAIQGLTQGSKYENRVVGRPENVIMTRVMAEYLQDTIERLARDWAKDRAMNIFAREAIIYREGMADTVRMRLRKLYLERVAESKRKATEDAARAQHPGAAPGTALVLASVIQNEDDLNSDYIRGVELGTTARERAEREARIAAYRAEQERLWREHEDRMLDDPEYAAEHHRKQEEALKREQEAEIAAAKKRRRSRSTTSYSYRENEQDRRRSHSAFGAGQRRGEDISLNAQVGGKGQEKLK